MGSDILVPMHLGNLHAYETALLALLAFGPFVGLVVVVSVLRRRDAGADEGSGAGPADNDSAGAGRNS